MKLLLQNIVTFLVHSFWLVQLYFGNFQIKHGYNGREVQQTNDPKPSSKKSKPTTTMPPSSSHLLFNLSSDSLLNLSDLITPTEEEMLRCLCAKGYTKNYRRRKLEKTNSEVSIPRDTFTNIWIDRCYTL